MFVVRVTPISRGSFTDYLSFFSKTAFKKGTIVTVPIRGKATPALVVQVSDPREEKLSLRESSFSLKKLTTRTSKHLTHSETVQGIEAAARLHALPFGVVFSHILPRVITNNLDRIKAITPADKKPQTASDTLIFQAEYDERIRMYRNLAREAFARGESLLLLTPTLAEAESIHEKLYRGIEDQVVMFSSAQTKKKVLDTWNQAILSSEPFLYIGTHSALAVPLKNIGTIILEREGARSYRAQERPHVDTRIVAECIAKSIGARIIFADFPLRIETRMRLYNGELEELMRMQVSARSGGTVRVVDAREEQEKERNSSGKKKSFSVFTEVAHDLIQKELDRGGRVFIYAARKGIAPLTVCNDCGTPVTDASTGTPMTLHKTEKGNVFLSHRSGAIVPSNTSCANCGGWNLVSLGIGVERVVQEVEKLFPDIPVFTLTTETAGTHAKAKKIQKQFFQTSTAVLVGTDRALAYLKEPVELAVVASIDSLLSIAAWRAHEYALRALFYIRDRTQDMFVVQTRQKDTEVMRAISTGNPTDFFQNEIRDRKTFGYPPFATFIGLTWIGTEKRVEKISEVVSERLKKWDVVGPLPAQIIDRNRFRARAVVRLPDGVWPDDTLVTVLKTLSPDVAVSVDPDEIV